MPMLLLWSRLLPATTTMDCGLMQPTQRRMNHAADWLLLLLRLLLLPRDRDGEPRTLDEFRARPPSPLRAAANATLMNASSRALDFEIARDCLVRCGGARAGPLERLRVRAGRTPTPTAAPKRLFLSSCLR
jgi:hypothetical protein